ncbi:hypothetical protein K437DRAFT_257487 [Tilletiaria anomala UBC 951]|uniref:Ornithine decarboxylase antizyme n=1 Tax=Tilletiaria anomala (strain ATCC 24038 / CBS 436.72 / UBC 951) TaxID=1037660 RepID=A0A066VNX6_TILAU|nr:uncharacterized protein K437DRAFT_257487 [Tilletiaria anomala UBC 951]KDN43427.1 hypothetical protein K437DRAFT_257487 [Tilletiaria anomala UBC 951]
MESSSGAFDVTPDEIPGATTNAPGRRGPVRGATSYSPSPDKLGQFDKVHTDGQVKKEACMKNGRPMSDGAPASARHAPVVIHEAIASTPSPASPPATPPSSNPASPSLCTRAPLPAATAAASPSTAFATAAWAVYDELGGHGRGRQHHAASEAARDILHRDDRARRASSASSHSSSRSSSSRHDEHKQKNQNYLTETLRGVAITAAPATQQAKTTTKHTNLSNRTDASASATAGVAGLMPPTPNATPSIMSSADEIVLDVKHDPARVALAFMRTVFPRFKLERANERLARLRKSKSASMSSSTRKTIVVEDASVELVCKDWRGAVLAVPLVSSVSAAAGAEDEDETEVERDEGDEEGEGEMRRTLYLSLPPTVTSSAVKNSAGTDAPFAYAHSNDVSMSSSTLPPSIMSSRASASHSPANNDATLPPHLRESLLSVLDHASEKLGCEKVVICVERHTTRDFKSLLHGLCYVGGQVVSYGPGTASATATARATGAGVSISMRSKESLVSSTAMARFGSPTSSMSSNSNFSGSVEEGTTLVGSSGSSECGDLVGRGDGEGDEDAVGDAVIVSEESENELSTKCLPGVEGLVPAKGLVLVAVDL